MVVLFFVNPDEPPQGVFIGIVEKELSAIESGNAMFTTRDHHRACPSVPSFLFDYDLELTADAVFVEENGERMLRIPIDQHCITALRSYQVLCMTKLPELNEDFTLWVGWGYTTGEIMAKVMEFAPGAHQP